ncbi:MAG: alpha/beta hydrolase [Pseudomonadales bacterium]|nr:alpha/beta hydrolase [Pseudomonadales bacterium]
MTSISARILKTAVRTMVKKKKKTPEKMVAHLRNAISLPGFVDLSPSGVKTREETIAGVEGYWIEVPKPDMQIMYIHGGGFVAGEPRMYFGFCGQLAKRLNANIYLPNYRKAPEFPYPAAPDDCIEVYKVLRDSVSAQPFILGGDSAGGNLALVTMLRAKDEGLKLPDCAMVLSPATDVTEVYSRQANNQSDDMFYYDSISQLTDVYLDGADPSDPYVSPSKGDFKGLPPLLITVSEAESLRDDSYKVKAKAEQEGIPVEMISRKNMPHVWPIMYPMIPEARQDMKRIVSFVESYT